MYAYQERTMQPNEVVPALEQLAEKEARNPRRSKEVYSILEATRQLLALRETAKADAILTRSKMDRLTVLFQHYAEKIPNEMEKRQALKELERLTR